MNCKSTLNCKSILAALLLPLVAARAISQEPQHGTARRLGDVRFTVSCNGSASGDFNVAVAQLHSFQFSRAIEGFDAVLQEDPSCTMAYWGIALSDWGNPFAPGQKNPAQLKLGQQAIERGMAPGARTDRERAYLAAVARLYADYESTPQQARLRAYRDAMDRLAAAYPDDREAQIFDALSIAVTADPADSTYRDRVAAGAILQKIFAEQPTHPGLAHYIIHAYDVPGLCSQALVAARSYAQIAPDAPHALHMPSHTFTRLGYWQESIDSNVAAAAAARRDGQTAEELHASDYETYAYLQTGQDEAAARIVGSLPELAARFDPKALLVGAGPPAAGYFALAAIPARYALERRDWRRAEQLPLRETSFPYADAMTWFARGVGAARLGHVAGAQKAAMALRQIQERLAKADERYWAQQVEIQATAVEAWAALAAGRKGEALARMELAAKLEDGTEKSVVTPGPLAPARELLGEMLLLMKRPGDALAQFEATLQKEPRRFWSLHGAARAAQLKGNSELSRKYFGELLSICERGDRRGRREIEEARQALASQKT